MDKAYPPSDIVWSDLSHIVVEDSLWKLIRIPMFTLSLSFMCFFVMNALDAEMDIGSSQIKLVIKYFCPLIMAGLTLYFLPNLVFELAKNETYCRKSVKESSFLTKNGLILTLNFVFSSFAGRLAAMFLYRGRKGKMLEACSSWDDMSQQFRNLCLLALQQQLNWYMRFVI